MKRKIAVCAVLALAVAGIAVAAVIFDAETGEGFVGKGDVQLVFGWNNKALQDNAHLVKFRYAAGESVTWTCADPDPTTPPFPSTTTRTNTQSVAGAPNGDPRKKQGQQQFTGFDLLGYIGDPVIVEEGQELHSCSANRAYVEGSDVVVSLGGGLEVSIDEVIWYPIG